MPWWLHVIPVGCTEERGLALLLGKDEVTVGKSEACTLVLPGARVSRRHCSFALTPAGPTVRDLGSSLGTLVNGRKSPRCTLEAGDTVTVDRCRIRILTSPPSLQGDEGTSVPDRNGEPAGVDWAPFAGFLGKLREAGDPRLLLERLLEGLVAFAHADRGFVLLADDAEENLVAVASHGIDSEGERNSISSTVCAGALREGSLLSIDDSTRHDLCADAPSLAVSEAPRSIVCAPLRAENRVVGVVYVDRLLAMGPWTKERITFFETITSLASELVAARQTRSKLLEARERIRAYSRIATETEDLVLGDGASSDALRSSLKAAAAQDVTVLITGETGTGKEMVARALHRLSPRRNGPFVPVHCAALPRDILEAELFGAEKGAYTGAQERRIGRFELASGGTLFLDEIGELPLEVQVKLLRVLQERSLVRLGATEPISLDFRLVCATNADLEAQVRSGRFRQDFYYRVNVFRILLAPLRERPWDILPLARHFLADMSATMNRRIESFAPPAERALREHPWPGNVRELRNAVERAIVVCPDERIEASHLPLTPSSTLEQPSKGGLDLSALPENYEEARDRFDALFLAGLLDGHDGNIRAVARVTGMSRTTLYKKLQKAGLVAPSS